ncbi:pectate lyase [Plectosphaerella cucumerina]|uniref:Pectate lyase n=1 Tax=Plectosphaerella cucumerina TaxID=40658 RepID=A0A8K0TM25_9PEZI|nr:pectate lyase [Plectosphaerella cucumerina]
MAGAATAQTLNIPARNGAIEHLPEPSIISGLEDMANREFDRGRPCNNDKDNGSDAAVFILRPGATLQNAIIGGDALEGVHCEGSCTIRNVWFRDVCEDAISILKDGNALIEGGGAQEAKDKVVQHNGKGTVTIKDFTVVNAGKLYRGCGDCTNNGGPRNVIIQNVKANNVANLVGINSNYGDTSSVSGTCGKGVKKVCQEFIGVKKGEGKSTEVDTTASCKGQSSLSAC